MPLARTIVYCQGAGPSTRSAHLRDDEPDDGCPNEGRYLTEHGQRLCGVCDMQTDDASVRISDLPRMIALIGDIASRVPDDIPAVARDVGDFLCVGYSNRDSHLSRADVADLIKLISKRGVTFR